MELAYQSLYCFEIGVLQLLHTQSVFVVTAVLSVRQQVHWLFVAKRHRPQNHSSSHSEPNIVRRG